ncbi:hypothetical protein VSS37_17960 [Candidatus Thiothrix sp. Deng01]|uniref:Transglutaminase elicitor n=1 Tax=Candidatus Thiothrix phosphatis TaxID=3112415 RepID=A0ABU6D1B3_9GAMM|nr:hypothetical protein [Candidatus Thiothrix sp. Deng01]MEB4592869.1 hypothetical protein [Candidatus Thiothrix sp. Deng01]
MSNTIEQQIDADLAAFTADPKTFMDRQPPKKDAQGNPVEGATLFSQEAIDDKSFIDAHDEQRMHILQPGEGEPGGVSTRAAIASNDKPADLVDTLKYTRLDQMESANLMKASLAESPWSDDYWGIYKGILGARYADPSFPSSPDWKENSDYIRSHLAATILASGNATKINQLSPAEKYDALVGDSNFSLTLAMWQEGKGYYDKYGSVETWMGICHGWSPAAYMLARPTKSVTLKTPDNVSIKFYPSDIKALGSLLWAKAPSRYRFIGGRCNDKEPATDPTTGRVKSSQCFDTNPGTWHLAIVNQIGVSKRSMVMDVTFDYEVWNQPTHAYEYRYFNPQTMTYASSLAAATVSMAAFTNDKFRSFRGAQSKSVVGVRMDVSYVVETSPSQNETDSPSRDAIQQVTYYYDLELDASNNIVGGEWYNNKHPDFLWTPAKGSTAKTSYDPQATGSWPQGGAVPSAWRAAAKLASSKQSAPLAVIVEQLIKLSNGTQTAFPAAAVDTAAREATPATPEPATPVPPPVAEPAVMPTPQPTPTPSPSTTGGSTAAPSGGTTASGSTTPSTTASTSSASLPWWRRLLNALFGG